MRQEKRVAERDCKVRQMFWLRKQMRHMACGEVYSGKRKYGARCNWSMGWFGEPKEAGQCRCYKAMRDEACGALGDKFSINQNPKDDAPPAA